MNGLLKNKTALITGGAKGHGRACAELFAAQGATVAIADIDGKSGEAFVSTLRQTNGDCVFYQADLTDSGQTNDICTAFLARFGAPDIWLNAAGVCHSAYVDELSDDDLQHMVSLNVLAAFRIMKNLATAMMEKRSGSVIQIASDYAVTGMSGVSGYAATKGALYAMANAFASDYAPYGIRVNSILPGMNFSSMGDKIIAELGEEEAASFFRCTQMLPERGELAHIANAALFLASDMSATVCGEGIMVNGGQNVIAHKQLFFRFREGRVNHAI